ncbi:PIN domain-containing protein [Novosphingobium aquae]|uniref:PIN domain-containing protein n=1 Tax=Novosphingobium aquae TaxID=3133435 RepID=A0ABU8SDP7_9SPHN
MFANRYTALIDACTLVSVWRRNLLLTLAEAEFFRVRWSSKVLEETERTLVRLFDERGLPDGTTRAKASIANMKAAFPEALVEDFELFETMSFGLPDEGDEHVLSAALKTQAQAIVTENLTDFPAKVLAPLGIEARSADDFIADTIALEEGKAVAAINRMRLRLVRPELSAEDLLRSFEANGLMETASVLAPHIESI